MRKTLSIVLGAVFLSMIGVAQAFCADVVGLVTDFDDLPIAAVKIVAKNSAGKIVGEANTDTKGNYRITGLDPGTYDYVLEPLATNVLGGDAVADLGSKGLTINWKVSAVAPAVASASEGTEVALADDDPFGMSAAAFKALGITTGAAAVTAGGVVGGYSAAGGFSGRSGSPSH